MYGLKTVTLTCFSSSHESHEINAIREESVNRLAETRESFQKFNTSPSLAISALTSLLCNPQADVRYLNDKYLKEMCVCVCLADIFLKDFI